MPEILTADAQTEWLSDDLPGEADHWPKLVERAERKVLDRYRESEHGTPLDHFAADPVYLKPVQLQGWQVDEDGTPDMEAMPDDLVTRLRDTISRIVKHWVTSVDGDIDSVSQGSKSVSYAKSAGDLPMSVWTPLRPYDDRTPYHGAV